MAKYDTSVSVDTSGFETKVQQKLFKMLNDKNVRRQANMILKKYIEPFVPEESGTLRSTAVVTDTSITWGKGLPYAHYQFVGEIYAKNYPIVRNGRIVRWYSKPGVKKTPTGRMIKDSKGKWLGYTFGYTTPGTTNKWTEEINNNQMRWKAQAGRDITAFLKAECKKRGLKT